MFDRLINRCVFVMKHASMEVNTFLLYRLISKNIKRFPERYTLCSCMHACYIVQLCDITYVSVHGRKNSRGIPFYSADSFTK